MKRFVSLFRIFSSALVYLSSCQVAAALWVNPDDAHLRADIQALASAKIIRVPVTTYPLMWDGVVKDIESYEHLASTVLLKQALVRVKQEYRKSQEQHITLSAGLASGEAKRFNHFGSPIREQGELTAGYQDSGSWWDYNIEGTYSYGASEGEELRLDNSYLAVVLGNWVLSGGYQAQWYGPGFDSALLMSTNARPLPSVYLTRKSPQSFKLPVLEWFGPWTLTTGFSLMDDERYMKDTILWTFRGTLRPHPNLELGVSRGAQMCGSHPDGYDKSCDLNTFWRVLTGDTNVWSGENPANQIASIDAKWTSLAGGLPYSFYIEVAGEDNFMWDIPPFDKRSYLYGADLTFAHSNSSLMLYFEISDTQSHCNFTNEYNCTYEHATYLSGYRYNQRAIGSTYDNDAQTVSLGFLGNNHSTEHKWKANLRYLMLNQDDSNKPPPGGNTVSDKAEDAVNVDVSYLFPIAVGELELGAEFFYSQNHDNSPSTTSVGAWGQWKYQF
jgi:hypothetical protein